MNDRPASEQVDAIIEKHAGWKGDLIKCLRTCINDSDQSLTEQVKWKTPTRPEGLPVWAYSGIVCFIEIWKDNVKLIFFKGARLTDQKKLFNARLESADIRAIEFHEGDMIDEAGIKILVSEAKELNG